jgi:hypothetical protein
LNPFRPLSHPLSRVAALLAAALLCAVRALSTADGPLANKGEPPANVVGVVTHRPSPSLLTNTQAAYSFVPGINQALIDALAKSVRLP